MKKTYFSPELAVVDVNVTAQLLAGSSVDLTLDTDATPIDPSSADAPGLDLGLPPSIATLIGL